MIDPVSTLGEAFATPSSVEAALAEFPECGFVHAGESSTFRARMRNELRPAPDSASLLRMNPFALFSPDAKKAIQIANREAHGAGQ